MLLEVVNKHAFQQDAYRPPMERTLARWGGGLFFLGVGPNTLPRWICIGAVGGGAMPFQEVPPLPNVQQTNACENMKLAPIDKRAEMRKNKYGKCF